MSLYHGIEPAVIFTMPPRLVLTYIRGLPMDSATMAALQGGQEYRGWGVTEYLLARVADSGTDVGYVLRKVNAKKNANIPVPKPVERPGNSKKKNPLKGKFAFLARQALVAGKGKNGGTAG